MKELAYKLANKFISEGTISSDGNLPNLKIGDVIFRMYTHPLVSTFGSCIPVSTPTGSIYSLDREYEINQNETVKKDYGNTSEQNTHNKIKFNVNSSPIKFHTKTLTSSWTLEALQNYINMFTTSKSEEEISEILANELTNECILELDYESFDLMYETAKKEEWSVTTTNNLSFGNELIEKIIFENILMLKNKTKESRVSVFCSPKIASKLSTHPNFERHYYNSYDSMSIYFIGSINNIDIFVDIYDFGKNRLTGQNTDYMLIGIKDGNNGMYSSINYFPFTTTIYSSTAQDNSDILYHTIHRYGIALAPGTNTNKDSNEMLKFIQIKL